MLQCSECEFFRRESDGRLTFLCDPFATIKEPECLVKWQILRLAEVAGKLDRIVAAHETQAAMYKRLGPLQEKMFRHMEREIDATDESERWKVSDDDWEDKDDEDDDPPNRQP